jgi:hypothetical protein
MSTIRLIFTGDFAPLLNINQVHPDHFREIDEILISSDAHITNLECPLTSNEESIQKTGPALKAQPDNIKLLKQANVSIACLANNHIFDFGEEGINDTLNICSENDIDTIGIINRPDGRHHWLIKEIRGKKIGFLNYCEHEFSVRDPGLFGACGYNTIDAFYDIGNLRPKVDYLIVIYHGGNEYFPLPNPEMKRVFHYLADLGADAVIGHHTHVYSGYEVYNVKPLLYSLGNFFFPYSGEPKEWQLGLICELNIGSDVRAIIHPVVQCEDKLETKIAESNIKQKVLNEIGQLSQKIIDEEDLQRAWKEFCEGRRTGYLKQFPCFSLSKRLALKFGIPMKYLLSGKKLRGYENLLRCQAHYEVMKSALRMGNGYYE